MNAAAAAYAAQIDAVSEQRARLRNRPLEVDRWAAVTQRFRMDPHREMDANLAALAAYVDPGDRLIDVGGGAGRVSLPLAGRCREVVCVDPSPSMEEAFLASAHEADITNARTERADWVDATVSGDITVVCNVTYFVRDIVRFIERLQERSRRRVLITVWSVPPPAFNAALYPRLLGEEQARVPGHQALLAVLWEMGLLPDVCLLPSRFPWPVPELHTRGEAIDWALVQLDADDGRARARAEAQFADLFAPIERGFQPLWRPESREMIITWRTDG